MAPEDDVSDDTGAVVDDPTDAAADAPTGAPGPPDDDEVDVPGEAPEVASDDEVGAPPDAPATAGGDPEVIEVEQLGSPNAPRREDALRLAVVGVPETARQRLERTGGFDLVQGVETLDDVDAVLVSTRLSTPELSDLLTDTLSAAPCPVVALAHTGGETAAASVMRHGGTAVIAEGNEAALRACLGLEEQDPWLVDVYARHAGHSSVHTAGNAGRDPVTGLPDQRRFTERLEELASAGDVPRVGLIRVLHLAAAIERLSPSSARFLRRRLITSFSQVATRNDVELYVLNDADLGFVGPTLAPNGTERLGRELSVLARTYSPGGLPLEVAIGHAGSEAGSEPTALRELAQRALQVAVVDRIQPVVGAEGLAVSLSPTTELETALRIVAAVEPHGGYPEGHGERLGGYAAQIAASVGLDPGTRTAIELAARLHDIGKADLPTEAMTGPDGLPDELLRTYRAHPARGAAYLRVPAGSLVAEAVRGQGEWWDGSGYPDGLAGTAIPFAARVLAAAHVLEELHTGRSPYEALSGLIGTRLDPELGRTVSRLAERRLSA